MNIFDLILRYQSERQALLDMRRVGCWYLKRLTDVKQLRMQINKSSTTSEVFDHLERFAWEPVGFVQPEMSGVSCKKSESM